MGGSPTFGNLGTANQKQTEKFLEINIYSRYKKDFNTTEEDSLLGTMSWMSSLMAVPSLLKA